MIPHWLLSLLISYVIAAWGCIYLLPILRRIDSSYFEDSVYDRYNLLRNFGAYIPGLNVIIYFITLWAILRELRLRWVVIRTFKKLSKKFRKEGNVDLADEFDRLVIIIKTGKDESTTSDGH